MTQHTTNTGVSPAGLILAYFLIYVVWGSTYFFIGIALDGFPPFLLGSIRFSVAGLLLLAFSCIRGEKAFRINLIRRSALTGIVLLFVDMAVVMLAQQYLSSSLVAIIASSTAIWILVLDIPMWKVNFRSIPVIGGVAAGFAGVALLFIEQLNPASPGQHGEYGIALLMAGCISWSLGTLYAKYHSSPEEKVNEFAGSAWQMLFASVLFWICSGSDAGSTSFLEIPAKSWLSLIYLIVFGSILAYSSYIWLLKVRPAAEVATHAYVNPLVAVLLGSVFGGEQITWIQISGLVIILTSIALIRRTKRKPRQGN